MQAYNGPERRKNLRIKATYLVSYRVNNQEGSYNLSKIKNISKGGMILMTNTSYAEETILDLIIRGPFSLEPLKVTGRVLDSQEIRKDYIYTTRINFSDCSQEELNNLDQFIKKNINK